LNNYIPHIISKWTIKRSLGVVSIGNYSLVLSINSLKNFMMSDQDMNAHKIQC